LPTAIPRPLARGRRSPHHLPNRAGGRHLVLSGAAKLAPDITLRLDRAVAEVLEQPEVRKGFARDAAETQAMSPAGFIALVTAEIAK
jgi:hypothetical protein